jgi:hypothetical protein
MQTTRYAVRQPLAIRFNQNVFRGPFQLDYKVEVVGPQGWILRLESEFQLWLSRVFSAGHAQPIRPLVQATDFRSS